MDYEVIIDEEFLWSVYEKNTDKIIKKFFFEEDAIEYAKFLEFGGGFSGWTPNFILTKTELEENINKKFENFFE